MSWYSKYRVEGSNRIVEINKQFDYVYKIPKDREAVFQNKSEAYIWEKTQHPYLCRCEIVDDIFIRMEMVDEDVSKGMEGIVDDRLPDDFTALLKKHPKLEYGFKNCLPKIYDYADCEFDWSLERPEDMFIADLLNIKTKTLQQ